MGVLETALKLAHQDADAEDEEEGGQRAAAAKVETLQMHSQMAWLCFAVFYAVITISSVLYLHHTTAAE